MKLLRTLTLVLLAPSAAAQVTLDVGPDPAPFGSPVFASISNDTNLIMTLGGCPWRILDDQGELVFEPTCLITELLIGVLGSFSYRWNQHDQGGAQVPPGRYVFEVGTPLGLSSIPFTVGGTDANLHVKGTPAIGTNVIGLGGRAITVASPRDPHGLFQVLAAFSSSPGVLTCGGRLPVASDPLLRATLRGQVLTGARGRLDGQGFADSALLPIPDQLSLVGLEFVLAFVVLTPEAACPVGRISLPLPLTIAPGPAPFPR